MLTKLLTHIEGQEVVQVTRAVVASRAEEHELVAARRCW